MMPCRGVSCDAQRSAQPHLRWRLFEAVDEPQLLQTLQLRGEAAVEAQDGVLDDGGDAQRVEHVHDGVPRVRHPVLAPRLLAEAIHLRGGFRDMAAPPAATARCALHLGYRARLVVAPQKRHAQRVLHLEREQQADCLHTVSSAVHVVAQEQEVVERRRSAHLEQLQQVVELAVDVAHDNDRRANFHAIFIIFENFSSSDAQLQQLAQGQQRAFPALGKHGVQIKPRSHARAAHSQRNVRGCHSKPNDNKGPRANGRGRNRAVL